MFKYIPEYLSFINCVRALSPHKFSLFEQVEFIQNEG